MTKKQKFAFFGALRCGLKLLSIMINRRVPVHACAVCKRLILLAFKMYHQTETVIEKLLQVNRPINCLEFYEGVIQSIISDLTHRGINRRLE